MFRNTYFVLNVKPIKIMVGIIVLLFSVSTAALANPAINTVSPAHLSQQDQVTQVSATVYNVSVITRFTVDDEDIAGTISGGNVSAEKNFIPGLHRVYLSVSDEAGNIAERSWQFYVNDPSKAYLLPDKTTCENCHPNTWKNFPGHMVDIRLGGHPHSCGACHYYGSPEQLIVRSDGSNMASNCMDCHSTHYGLYLEPPHGHTAWKGTWPESGVPIKSPRESFDCQYCHQPGTKVRLGHDLVADHEAGEAPCTSCHSAILTVTHNSNGNTCNTCHGSSNPTVQSAAQGPMAAKAGTHFFCSNVGTGKGIEIYSTQEFNDLNLGIVSLVVYGPDLEVVSEEWAPGPGLEISRLKVDGWNPADEQYILAYIEQEGRWQKLSVAAEGQILYKRYPVTSPARLVYLPPGTTKIKTMVRSGPGDSNYQAVLNVKEAYYGKPVKCTGCHSAAVHEGIHNYNLDRACQTCHLLSLTQEHMNNPKTQTKTLDCDTCHNSNNPAVTLAVNTHKTECAACHSKVHTTDISESMPADIPLYQGFCWSSVMNAHMWAGEPWMPAEFADTGRVLVSDLRSDISRQDIETYYHNEMTAQGWLPVELTQENTDCLQLGYVKDTREVCIFRYSGPVPNTAVPGSNKCRLLILYK
ncbi:MAG: hypothetical protein CVU89_01625 [Firmicutes bacterium HGW-Firmicutes-14]|nr:MAG: hypothetical protein CVU89_01625 [Firmicutes bacterium HGW-Firmicutes-14]